MRLLTNLYVRDIRPLQGCVHPSAEERRGCVALPAPEREGHLKAPVVMTDVSKTYRLGKVAVPALEAVSLRVDAGEFLAIVGPSGSGKTPGSGEIEIDGEAVGRLSPGRRAELRTSG